MFSRISANSVAALTSVPPSSKHEAWRKMVIRTSKYSYTLHHRLFLLLHNLSITICIMTQTQQQKLFFLRKLKFSALRNWFKPISWVPNLETFTQTSVHRTLALDSCLYLLCSWHTKSIKLQVFQYMANFMHKSYQPDIPTPFVKFSPTFTFKQ